MVSTAADRPPPSIAGCPFLSWGTGTGTGTDCVLPITWPPGTDSVLLTAPMCLYVFGIAHQHLSSFAYLYGKQWEFCGSRHDLDSERRWSGCRVWKQWLLVCAWPSSRTRTWYWLKSRLTALLSQL